MSIPFLHLRRPLLGAADPRHVDAVEEHRELGGIERRAESAILKGRQPEAPLLEALVEDDEAPAVPGEDLHPVAPAGHEDEEMPGEDVLVPVGADDGFKTVDALAKINWLSGEQDANGPWQQEHGGYPSAAINSAT